VSRRRRVPPRPACPGRWVYSTWERAGAGAARYGPSQGWVAAPILKSDSAGHLSVYCRVRRMEAAGTRAVVRSEVVAVKSGHTRWVGLPAAAARSTDDVTEKMAAAGTAVLRVGACGHLNGNRSRHVARDDHGRPGSRCHCHPAHPLLMVRASADPEAARPGNAGASAPELQVPEALRGGVGTVPARRDPAQEVRGWR